MKVTFDPVSDAMYMYITEQEICNTVSVSDRLLVDVDRQGNAVGIEILDASSQHNFIDIVHKNTNLAIPVTLISGEVKT